MRVFSVLYWSFFAASCCAFYVIAAAIYLIALPFDRRRILLHMYMCAWGSFYVYCNPFWRVRTTGRSRLPWSGPAVLVANHSSIIDILLLFTVFRPFKWISKRSNFNLPIIGWLMWMADYVPLVRGNRESVLQMIDRCKYHLNRGSPLLFFPEGTRSPDGRLRPFKDGAFLIARQTGCPVIPIAVHGTERVLPKHGFFFKRMSAHVEVLAPIDSRCFESTEALRDAAHGAIEKALAAEGADRGSRSLVGHDLVRPARLDQRGRTSREADASQPSNSGSGPGTSALP